MWLTPTATAYSDQVIWHIEDALRATIGDRLVEKPELISFPSEPTRREIAAFSVIVARCGVPKERPASVDNRRHSPSRSGHRSEGLWSISAELIVEDQPKRIIQIKLRSALRREPEASLDASIASAGSHAPCVRRTPKAGPRLPKRDRLHRRSRNPRGATDAPVLYPLSLSPGPASVTSSPKPLTADHIDESLRQHALRLSQRLKNGEMVGTVYRQQMAGKAPFDPCLGILDGLPA